MLKIIVHKKTTVVAAFEPIIKDAPDRGKKRPLPHRARESPVQRNGTLSPANKAISDWKVRLGFAPVCGYGDLTWLSAAVITSSRCGYSLIGFARLTKADRLAVNECSKSDRSFRSTTHLFHPSREYSFRFRFRCFSGVSLLKLLSFVPLGVGFYGSSCTL